MSELLQDLGLGPRKAQNLAKVLVETENIVSIEQLKFLHLKGFLMPKLKTYRIGHIVGEYDILFLDNKLQRWNLPAQVSYSYLYFLVFHRTLT